MKKKKIFWVLSISIILTIITTIWLANRKIDEIAKDSVYNEVSKIPYNKVGLLLGTSKTLSSGEENLYFMNRIVAVNELFKAHKISYIVISGDNNKKEYNEPLDMKNELLKVGIPDSSIILDYAGFRTYDSVIRINKIFGQEKFTIISQEFHNRRAIYISNRLGCEAIGFNAKDVNMYKGFRTKLRENFARVKVFIDFWVNEEPKFLGEKIDIK